MKELEELAHTLKALDSQGEFSLIFYHNPERHYQTVTDMLHITVASQHTASEMTQAQLQNRYDQALSRLMSEFWPHMYAAHEVHFHTSFDKYCNCPFTCLTELVDCVAKVAGVYGKGIK